MVRDYLGGAGADSAKSAAGRPAFVSQFRMRTRAGEGIRFASGEAVRIDTEITARERVERLSVSLGIVDEKQYMLFSASTERLGERPFTLEAGEKISWTFEIDAHLAPGTYHVGIALYRYDIQKDFGQFPCGTFFVHAETDVRGVVNLYPRIVPPGAPFP